MEQRPLRLGDIVDDYCTRERRITNHAIVAIVGVVIRQTRCTTCDTEHAYRAAKEPRLRKKPQASELYEQVLADVTGGESRPEAGQPAPDPMAASADEMPSLSPDAPDQPESNGPAEPAHDDVWPGHRRLIRATLPRSENDPPLPRPIPEFTMHQRPPSRGDRGFRFRGGGGGNGNGPIGPGPNGPGQGRHGHSFGRPGRHRRKRSR